MFKRAMTYVYGEGKDIKSKLTEKMEGQCEGTIRIIWSRLGVGKEVILVSRV